jgi:hypothetical protein
MTIPTYTVPDNPPDPEDAALELIVRLPADILHDDDGHRRAIGNAPVTTPIKNALALDRNQRGRGVTER